ncbi:MAG: site-2 protease family protein, partial [Nanoarchaeota archaeon]
MEYTKNELKYFLVIILTLAFAFAFNDKAPEFSWNHWLVNFFKMIVFVAISVFVHDFAHDLAAKKYGFLSEYRTWGVKRFWFGRASFPKTIKFFGKEYTISSFPLGIVLCLLVALLSNGKLFFTAVSSYGLVIKKTHRFGHKMVEVTDLEEAKIALAGPMANIMLALVCKLINADALADMVLINSIMPVFDMLPIFGLDGMKVLMGSRPMYIFSFVFILALAILLYTLESALPALVIAAAIALILFIGYMWQALTK